MCMVYYKLSEQRVTILVCDNYCHKINIDIEVNRTMVLTCRKLLRRSSGTVMRPDHDRLTQ